MENKSKILFNLLDQILSVATDIKIITQNQETIILQNSENEMLAELVSNKQKFIVTLNELESQFQSLYSQNKALIKDKMDIERLQSLVGQVVETKEGIAQAEEQNRRLWASKGKGAPKAKAEEVNQPKSYVANQYKKHSKLER